MSTERFLVVRNAEEQYSVWFADREPPAGWAAVGFEGSREECLARINELWTDIRPLSLRRAMAAGGPMAAADPMAAGDLQ